MSNLDVPPAMTEEHANMLTGDLELSDARGESPEDLWSSAHDRRHPFWLSGTDGLEVWNRLGVADQLKVGVAVLNVGIGMGKCTRQLVERGCCVSVLDISQEALDSVADVAPGYLSAALERLPAATFDVALSHLVAQHMNDKDLEDQIRHVVRSLKPGGVFAVQYAIGDDGQLSEQSDRYLKAGAVRRTVAGFNSLVERAGGNCVETLERESHPCGTLWRVALIGRQVQPSLISRILRRS